MKRRILAFLSAFIISINLIGTIPITVYASGGGYNRGSTDLTGYDSWSMEDKFDFWLDNVLTFAGNWCGVIFNPTRWTIDDLHEALEAKAYELYLAEDSASFQEYILKHVGVNDNGEYYADDEMVDLMYQVCVDLKGECGWYEMQTLNYRDYPASEFKTQGLYESFIGYCTKNLKGTDNVLFTGSVSSDVIYLTEALSEVEYYVSNLWTTCIYAYITQDWSTQTLQYVTVDTAGTVENTTSSFGNRTYFYYSGAESDDLYYKIPLTDGSRTVRIYKSLEDLKSYSVGQRPYYVTDKFQDYDINGDNSCILSESDLSNGSVYGDVYNYIINNYDNPDGLTEDELRDILDDYLSNSGGGSGSSGNDSGSGSSGNGLLDFLGGLGSIGDAILSILGKLMEYIGKALDLIGGTVTKVIDIIPKNITALLGALFPFFPEEWLTAIELGLVLAVIVGIVGLFKK